MYRFCVDIYFHFSGINTQTCNCGSHGNCMFSFIKSCQTVFQSSWTILLSHSNVWVTQCLHILVSTWCLLHFYFRHSDRCVVTPHCGVICISLMAGDVKYVFLCIIAICISSNVKSGFFCPFSNREFLLF